MCPSWRKKDHIILLFLLLHNKQLSKGTLVLYVMHTLLILLITCTLSLIVMAFLRDVHFVLGVVSQCERCRVRTGNVADPQRRIYTNEVTISYLNVSGQ